MAATQTADIRALLGGGADEDRVAAAHFLVGALFLVLAGALELFALFSLRFSGLSPLSFGRLEAMSNVTIMLGFLVVTLTGGIYYVLPRLTGARLWRKELASAGLLLVSGLVLVDLLAVVLGFGGGRQPLGLPWWLHIPMLVALSIPAAVTLMTVRNRVEKRSFVTLWFVIGGVTWLPLLYLVYFTGDLPFISALGEAYSDLFFSAGFVTLWVFTVGSGLFYYTMVKELDIPLASRQLASVGFWSLGFAAAWWGSAQLVFGPGPGWVDGVAASLGLAFPIGALANASSASLTLQGHWEELPDKPGVGSGVIGLYLGVAVAILASFASFPSIGAVAALSAYWEAIEYAALFGVGVLLGAGVVFEALPRVSGRDIRDMERPRSFNRLTVIGVGGVLISLLATGLVTGYSWVAGSNSAAYVDAGDGWAAGAGIADVLLLFAFGFGIVAFLGQLAYSATVIGTIFNGRPVPQEVLIYGDQTEGDETSANETEGDETEAEPDE
ncbi:MAG: cbb3-type cytochrome c oxidase subunit I [Acidimicrobiia bacterium]